MPSNNSNTIRWAYEQSQGVCSPIYRSLAGACCGPTAVYEWSLYTHSPPARDQSGTETLLPSIGNPVAFIDSPAEVARLRAWELLRIVRLGRMGILRRWLRDGNLAPALLCERDAPAPGGTWFSRPGVEKRSRT